MKKIVISVLVLIATSFFAVSLFSKMSSDKSYYSVVSFKRLPSILEENDKVVLFITQEGCSQCKLVEPLINDYAKDNKGVVYSVVQNQDEDAMVESKKLKIQGTPTMIYFKENKEIYRTKGGFTDADFQETLEKVGF